MNKVFASLVVTLLSAAPLLAACGGDGAGTGGGGAGGNGTGATTGTGAASPECDAYCAQIMDVCKAANQQYRTTADCLAVCAAFPPGVQGDKTGNSLACRVYHTGAAVMSSPDVHCNHAGPGGGDQDPTDDAPGNCGEACEAFCQIAQMACTGENQQYADLAACKAECKTFKSSTDFFDASDTSKDDFNCRLYHVTAAASEPAPHCGHIKSTSPVCTQ